MNTEPPLSLPLASSEETAKTSRVVMVDTSENTSAHDPNRTASVITHDEVFSEPDDAGQEHDEGSDNPTPSDEDNDGLGPCVLLADR